MARGDDKDVDVWVYEEDERLQTKTFNGKPIVNINSEDLQDASAVAVLVSESEERIGWTGYTYGPPYIHRLGEQAPTFVRLEDPDPVDFEDGDDYRYQYDSNIAPAVVKAFYELLNHKDLAKIDTLVLGQWGGRYTDSTDIKDLLDLLLEYEASFPSLKALFVGAVSTLDLDIHDIQLCKMGFLLNYFTQLETFKARGAPNQPYLGDRIDYQVPTHLRTFFEMPIHHDNLKNLTLETADMDRQTIENLSKSHLPKLEHLELWFGEVSECYLEEYDYESESDMILKEIKILLKNSFPSLRYLGLRNCSQANDIAIMLADLPILKQLDELDLSLGNFGDTGARALLNSPYIDSLKKITFHHHNIENIGLIRQFEAKLPEVDFNNGINRKASKPNYGFSWSSVFVYE